MTSMILLCVFGVNPEHILHLFLMFLLLTLSMYFLRRYVYMFICKFQVTVFAFGILSWFYIFEFNDIAFDDILIFSRYFNCLCMASIILPDLLDGTNNQITLIGYYLSYSVSLLVLCSPLKGAVWANSHSIFKGVINWSNEGWYSFTNIDIVCV